MRRQVPSGHGGGLCGFSSSGFVNLGEMSRFPGFPGPRLTPVLPRFPSGQKGKGTGKRIYDARALACANAASRPRRRPALPVQSPECIKDQRSSRHRGENPPAGAVARETGFLDGSYRFRAAFPPGPHVQPDRSIGFQPSGAPSVLEQGPVQCPEPAGLDATSGRRCECLTGLCPRTAPQGAREEGDPFSRHAGSQLRTRETAAAHVLEAPGNWTRPGTLRAPRPTPCGVAVLGRRLERECFPLRVPRCDAAR